MDASTDTKPELSAATLAALDATAARGIMRALVAQGIMGLLAGLISWGAAGSVAGASALIGAGAYFVPNMLFALRLLAGLHGHKKVSPLTFFLGEGFKLVSAVLLLGLAAFYGHDWLVWPALLFGLLCALKGYVLLLLFHKMP